MSQYRCCERQTWVAIADLGHTSSCDFDLGRCENCGACLMLVTYGGSGTFNVLSKDEAERFIALQESPELKPALKEWFDG